MKNLLMLAAGIWIGRELFTTHLQTQANEQEEKIRKKLEQFIKENQPELKPKQVQKKIESILQ